MEQQLYDKFENLKQYLKDLKSVAVAFSSGVDSTFLLKVAQMYWEIRRLLLRHSHVPFQRENWQKQKHFVKKRVSGIISLNLRN